MNRHTTAPKEATSTRSTTNADIFAFLDSLTYPESMRWPAYHLWARYALAWSREGFGGTHGQRAVAWFQMEQNARDKHSTESRPGVILPHLRAAAIVWRVEQEGVALPTGADGGGA
jgi:hypothetical protein